jgi:hypothetical protein
MVFLPLCASLVTPDYSLFEGLCRNQAWLLKNSFQGISPTKFVRQLLNVRSPQALKFAELVV